MEADEVAHNARRQLADQSAAALAADLVARAAQRRAEDAASAAAAALPPAPAMAPAAPARTASDSALRLLQFEAEIRRLQGQPALLAHLVNEVRGLLPYGQAIVWQRRTPRARWRPLAVTGLVTVDPHTALLEAIGHRLSLLGAPDTPVAVDLLAEADTTAMNRQKSSALQAYPLPHALWVPLPDRAGEVDAGALFLAATPFSPGATVLLARLGETYAHAWSAMDARRRRGRSLPVRWALPATMALVAAAGMVPVRLSVMAPVEVVAEQPSIITAPISGVVRQVAVPPGTPVKAGDMLVTFDDIQPRNEMLLAQQRLAVAQARHARVTAAAFQDPSASHELATAQAELQLARVNFNYAVEVLARTKLRAPHDGVVLYADRRTVEGRAVQVGEEIVQVAEPDRVAMRVDLSTADTLQLPQGAAAQVFLEQGPLGGQPAQVAHAAYAPRTLPGGATAYTVLLTPGDGPPLRIGARGTARLFGDEVPLAVQLLRRPLAAFRQWAGV